MTEDRRPKGMAGCPREPRQENHKTEIRKRKGKEIEKERKKKKTNSSLILRKQYANRKSQISQGSNRVGVFFINIGFLQNRYS